MFKLECAAPGQEDSNFILDEPGETQGTTKCNLHFKMRTRVACPDYVSSMTAREDYLRSVLPFAIVYYLFMTFFAYNLVGYVYNS